MAEWPIGQLLRAKHHRFLFVEGTGEVSVAVGTFNLERRQFRVTHALGSEPPQVGELLILLKGMDPESPEEEVWITSTVNDLDDQPGVTYSFRRKEG